MSGSVPRAGDPAPDFTLPDTHGTPTQLADLRGQSVLLVFFPFAFSGTCTAELSELRDTVEDFEAAGVRLLAVSTDPVFTLKAWQEIEGFGFDLLSDFWPHGAAASAFGVFDEESGHALRGSFLVDADGIVRWSLVRPRGARRELDEYRAALAEI
ncbi:peroxiredoxin [Isoptericola sp. CG 20/1183]|uniref:Peroxiredoxin n=1 Tax=Isoptericola halotolerans TaxID=300560 RepID=A0ABX5EA22_9MICO|nr:MULTISPECIES: peroxiredoxin [Isoptericola]MCK0118651.1 peroxiredoxin [Isoptericola sp. S6320L]PRZ03199.1 peroxiredoxin [Isoptericola sp. CG 20/1183]PRZ03589.1 peroxiredoxin [Isoptericola halotolerans]